MPTDDSQVPASDSKMNDDGSSAIVVEQMQHTYLLANKPISVLDNISLRVLQGSFVSVLGPSGCGKSTLLNILAGLEAPTSGWYQINFPPTDDQSAEATSHTEKRIAYMQQKDLLLPWRSILDNVLLEAELRVKPADKDLYRKLHKEAQTLIQRFGLTGFAYAYPAQLSGGMRQRAALARTLLWNHPILLLDEPFGALDAINRYHLQQYLHQLWLERGLTVLLVTHDVEEALQLSTQVVLLSRSPARIVNTFTLTEDWESRARSVSLLNLKAEILEQLSLSSAAHLA